MPRQAPKPASHATPRPSVAITPAIQRAPLAKAMTTTQAVLAHARDGGPAGGHDHGGIGEAHVVGGLRGPKVVVPSAKTTSFSVSDVTIPARPPKAQFASRTVRRDPNRVPGNTNEKSSAPQSDKQFDGPRISREFRAVQGATTKTTSRNSRRSNASSAEEEEGRRKSGESRRESNCLSLEATAPSRAGTRQREGRMGRRRPVFAISAVWSP